MIKAIIFDFDGVIVETENHRLSHLKELLQKKKFIVHNLSLNVLIGKKTRSFLKETIPNITEKEIDEIYTEQSEILKKKQEEYVLLEGLNELLEFLKNKEYALAVCTGSRRLRVKNILKQNGVLQYFKIIVSGEDFSSSKPDPECYEKTLQKLDLSADEVIIIEDSPAGITAGKNVGAKVFGLMTYLDEAELKEADRVFKSHVEILVYLKHRFDLN